MDRSDSVRGDSLKWPILISILWLAVAAAVIGARYGEFWGLPLNGMGDVLAGVFAPLAFFWLFIATSLQRRELGLQRQELAETRKVLNEQRKELERSVQESNHQTHIMQRTLETTQSREIYDEFRLRLYYLAKYLNDYRLERFLATIPSDQSLESETNYYVFFMDRMAVNESDNTSVDELFRRMQQKIGPDFSVTSDRLAKSDRGSSTNNQLLFFLTRATSDLDKILNNDRYKSVPLISERMRSLDLKVLLQRLQNFRTELSSALYPSD